MTSKGDLEVGRAVRRLGTAAAVVLASGSSLPGSVSPPGEPRVGGQEARPRSVTVVGLNPEDGRFTAVRAAIGHWNEVFRDLELPVPFGEPRFRQTTVPEELLLRYSAGTLRRRWPAEPNPLSAMPGTVVVVLSDSAIVSFTAPLARGRRAVVGLRTGQLPPLSLPNVAINVAAHELGHVLGLGHNDDATRLMCGRPADCRPSDFHSDERRFFDLSEAERRRLVILHGRR